MALVPVKPSEGKERIIIYARAGMGKSRFALSLPDTEKWGEILYYAADENAENLASLHPSRRHRVNVLKPDSQHDMIHNFQQFCMQDWRPHYPKVKTLVVDTYTKIVRDAVQHSANTKSVTKETHFVVGDPNKGGQIIPNRGDIEGVNALSWGFLDKLYDKQRHYNIILVFHEDSKKISTGQTQGGPAHPGWDMYEYLPSKVDTVIRLDRATIMVPGASVPEMRVVAITEHDGLYTAKVRESNYDGNPLARVVLDRDPSNFWIQYDKVYERKEGE